MRVVGREIFGLRSFSPLEGERAENRWGVASDVAFAGVETEFTEAVDALRSPLKEMESRAPLRGKTLLAEEVIVDEYRGTREEEEGEP